MIQIDCVHGFLGRPSDWDFLRSSSWRIEAWNFFPEIEASTSLPKMGESLVGWANTHPCSERSLRLLVGYSLGGRIALHALVTKQAQDLWDAAIIVSTHPGLASDLLREKEARLGSDKNWASRFENEPWDFVVDAWEEQEVFKNSLPLSGRIESQFSRSQLSNALSELSLAKQEDLRPGLAHVKTPILWIAGELDPKFSDIARKCASLNPRFSYDLIAGAGHRAPWDRKELFRAAAQNFLNRRKWNVKRALDQDQQQEISRYSI